MRQSNVDFAFKRGGKLFVTEAKSFKMSRERQFLQRFYAVFKNSPAHPDINPNNVIYIDGTDSVFNWVVSTSPTPSNNSRSARAVALAKALSVTRVGRTVRVVASACYLLKVLKKALKIIAALFQAAIAPTQQVIIKSHVRRFDHGWIKTHGPRPPRHELKAAGVLLQQVHGRVQSPLAA